MCAMIEKYLGYLSFFSLDFVLSIARISVILRNKSGN